MSIRVSRFIVTASALAALAFPSWAAHRDTARLTTKETTTIGSKTLTPGDYELRAEEGSQQLQILRDGKVIAEVPIHWYQLSSKPAETEVISNQNSVQEVHFAGHVDAVKVDSSMADERQ